VLVVFDFRRYPKVNIKLTEIFRDVGANVVAIGDSPISPSAKLAEVLFLVESKGAGIFDSYTAGFTLINALMAAVTRRSGEYVRQRYETLERYYSRFEIFSGQELNPKINRLPTSKQSESQQD
jgi:DNA-binding MurR/RpiR family transcriptional regulator